MPDMKPALIAEYDQLMECADRELSLWVDSCRKAIAEHGEIQGIANIGLALSMDDSPRRLSWLIAAIRRLAIDQHYQDTRHA